ncbi:MAG: hypothetical protein QM760_20290 [Nibricoccus sp.]
MAEENESSGGSRWSLGAFLKFETVLIATVTILLYLQALIYVEALCGSLGIPREMFALSFSDVVLYAWPHLTAQGIFYGSIVVGILFGVPAAIAIAEMLLFWVIRRLAKRKRRRNERPESREERRLSALVESRWRALVAASITMAIGISLFSHSFKKAMASAEKDGKSRLENKTISSVTLTKGDSLELIFLAHVGETYAFVRPGTEPRRYVMLPRSEITKLEFSESQAKTKEDEKAPALSASP